ncbi:sulfite exporter TauE/SafE family protein [Tsukamurella tyrosinosolvens]|uniref:sulfite exporter TauE/SafE family protein n=1 Tax=Tsukamurella tyrosinosolvens TaxID=57704 RepID=UPI000C7F6DA1|nr:transporter [Tsukamurella tyrosinosolvens]
MTLTGAVILVLAGFGSGIVGYLTGLASLVSYPALLAAGLPPTSANVTNTVAMVAVGAGGITRSSAELSEDRAHAIRLAALAIPGGAIGAALVLVAPREVFELVVPSLIALASATILIQPRLRERVRGREYPKSYLVGTFLVSVYGGYFSAGAGVMALAVIAVLTSEPLWRGAMLKTYVTGLASLVAASSFAVFADVDWTAAVALALGGFAGGWCGPPIARRVPEPAVRGIVGVGGFVLAVWLLLRALTG